MASTQHAERIARAARTVDYRSRFRSWYERASVRGKPRRIVESLEEDKLFFPPELVPVATHPLVSEQGEDVARRVLLRRLYLYLDFTADLEQLAVNPVAQAISRRRVGLDLPDGMVRDAYKVCTDESWHAHFSDDLVLQISVLVGEPPLPPNVPYFLRRLESLERTEPPDIAGLTKVFFTVVSETLISAILSDIPHDQRVVGAVRSVIADHAEDEGRHHAMFADFFHRCWPQLSASQRALLGPRLAQFVEAFLLPDQAGLRSVLDCCELTETEKRGVIQESHSPGAVRRNMRIAAESTLRMFREQGVFDDPATHDAFCAVGLLP
jgi:hypothetical protein